MTRIPLLIVFTFLLTLSVAATASAELTDVTCNSGRVAVAKPYFSADNAWGDTRANTEGRIRLWGWVYVPKGTPPKGGFPILIFNHGSEETPGERCTLADFFVSRKYILFVPVRRGHEGSTGLYFDEYSRMQADAFCALCPEAEWRAFKRMFVMEYLRAQGDEVTDAINYVRNNFPTANPNRVGVIGHSFGAMVSLMWNKREGEHTKAIVSFSAGAQSWGETDPFELDHLQWALRDAVRHARRPIYFLQPVNDVTTAPTAELAREAGLRQMRWQAAVFAAVPDQNLEPCPREDADGEMKTCADIAHAQFVINAAQIKKWGPTVVEFLKRFGVR